MPQYIIKRYDDSSSEDDGWGDEEVPGFYSDDEPDGFDEDNNDYYNDYYYNDYYNNAYYNDVFDNNNYDNNDDINYEADSDYEYDSDENWNISIRIESLKTKKPYPHRVWFFCVT